MNNEDQKAAVNIDAPPFNDVAEKSVLGSIMIDPSVMPMVCDALKVTDFYSEVHRDIFRAMRAIDDEGGSINLATICGRLLTCEAFKKTDGSQYLKALAFDIPSATAIKTYCAEVRRCSICRDLMAAGSKLTHAVKSGAVDCCAVVQSFKDSLDEIMGSSVERSWQTFEEGASAALLELEEQCKGERKGVDTGFIELDEKLAGLRPGSLTIIAARPGMGKTALALNMAHHVAVVSNKPTAFFSLEMTTGELVMRLLSSQANVSGHSLRLGNVMDVEWASLFDAMKKMAKCPMYIEDTPAISVGDLRDRARRIQREHGLECIFVDYLQLMSSNSKRINTREQEVSDISRKLKGLAKELGVPVICLSQLNRGVESRTDKRPVLSDLRESGAIEQDADNILFIHREDYYNHERHTNEAEIIIAKQRAGATGRVEVMWDGATTTFRNKTDKTFDGVLYDHEYF